VTDDYGNPLAPRSFDFYVLAGDANRDRIVNFSDLLILAKAYNKALPAPAAPRCCPQRR
jgi:hypothetical protein